MSFLKKIVDIQFISIKIPFLYRTSKQMMPVFPISCEELFKCSSVTMEFSHPHNGLNSWKYKYN